MKTYLSLIASILFVMCSDDVLDRTIFIPDEHDKNLPAYTEWGYNSFGARYERLYFLASESIVPCKVIYQNGLLNFYLSGNLRSYTTGSDYYFRYEDMALTFSFPYDRMTAYADLVALHDTRIDLTATSCTVTLERDYMPVNIDVYRGYLFFKRAQLLGVDGVTDRVILSGEFDLQFLSNGKPGSISSGRFDVGINTEFYGF
jgi:hypothetical protein